MGLPQGLLARVQSNDPCPALAQRPGRVVLTTVSHLNSNVWEIDLADERGMARTIRPTGTHKFYNASRREWTSAKDLKPGERLRGILGSAAVRSVARVPGVHRVYNMTVEADHVYRVSDLCVLVHNDGCAEPVVPPLLYRSGGKAPSNFTPRDVDQGMLSTRGSLSNPVGLPAG